MANNEQIKYLRDICNPFSVFDYTDKKNAIALYINTMLARTQRIFEYTNLPETIPARMLENYLQRFGAVCITEYKDNLYAFFGGLGGEPNEYYQPTLYTISNPYLNYSADLKIGEHCEIIRNDTFYMGLIPLFTRYATAMCETDISLDMAVKHTRALFNFTVPDDRTKLACEKYLQDIADGKDGAILDKSFADLGIAVNPVFSSGLKQIQELTEYLQYIKAAWFNEIGLNANFNMKRENLNESETEMNFDALLPLIDEMLTERKEGCERVNKLYGTNISVKLSGVWAKTEKEMTETEQGNDISERPETPAESEGDENAET